MQPFSSHPLCKIDAMELWDEITNRAERRHGVVAIADLVRAGATRNQIKRWVDNDRLVSCGYGTFRVAGAPASYDGSVLAAIEEFPGETWASHRTAGRLHGLPVSVPPGLVEVTRPVDLSAQRSAAVVHRSSRIPDHHRVVVRGIPCLSVSRTVFDLARTVPVPVLRRVVDRGLIGQMCTIGSLWQVLYDVGGRGRPGTRRMREVLEAMGEGYVPPASQLEAVGMALLDGRGFEWQVELSDERGYIRRVDGLHRSRRLVVEFDGPQHQREPQRSHDTDGDRRLEALGLEVLRLDWSDVTVGAAKVLGQIDRRLD